MSQHLFKGLVFRQLFEHVSSTYTYLLACPATREALIIDPVLETVNRDAQLCQELKLKLKYAINTHVHADHVTGTGELKKRFAGAKSIISASAEANADVHVKNGDTIRIGTKELEVFSTPGHTNGCMAYVSHEHRCAFTGDALLIRGCGRTDFQQGNASTLYDSIKRILSLPGDYLLFPAHDYKGMMVTSVQEELEFNPRFTKGKEKFVEIMHNLKLAYPKQIDKAVPANMVCGIYELMDEKTKVSVEPSLPPAA